MIFGGIKIVLEGKVTALLKNLAPLRKEKEYSAEFLHSLKKKITLCERALRRRYG